MATSIAVVLEDRPGTLADLSEALGGAGVNIDGFCCTSTGEGRALAHVLVEDAAGARQALAGAGIEVQAEREVLILDVEDRPGALGEVARRMGNAGVNLEVAYLATRTRVVLGADDPHKARAALG